MLSTLDMKILKILFEDARITASEIALMTGYPEQDVITSIEKLEADKIIVKYGALINWDKADSDLVQAIIEVRVTPQRDQGFDSIASRIYRFDEVNSVYLMSGAYDLLLLVEGRTMKEVALFVAERLSVLENVLSTATHFVLKKYKADGVLFYDAQTDKRMAVSP